jgi:hydroxypyruvate isomerase
MKFAVNLSTIFTEVPFLDRFKKAKEAGFSYVEAQFPYPFEIQEIKANLEKYSLSMVLINLPPGDWARGDRGISIQPSRTDEFKRSVEAGITYASSLQTTHLHCMAGVLTNELGAERAREQYMENILYASSQFAHHGLTLLLEPINTFDIPGYFMSTLDQALSIIKEVNRKNIMLQFDFYHIRRIHGNVLATFQESANYIKHIQIADFPDRHQPGTGEINFDRVIENIKDQNYEGFIGLEYIPSGKSEDSFNWLHHFQ